MIALSLKGLPPDHESPCASFPNSLWEDVVYPFSFKTFLFSFLLPNPRMKITRAEDFFSNLCISVRETTLAVVLTICSAYYVLSVMHCTWTQEGKFVWALGAVCHLATSLSLSIVQVPPLPRYYPSYQPPFANMWVAHMWWYAVQLFASVRCG